MNWSESISKAIDYIEQNLDKDISINDISKQACISPYYFQKGFTMLCGYTIGEYIRNRRLSVAAYELLNGDSKIIDIALKYGYDSPDSFTKAFTRFHGATPIAIRNKNATIKDFTPLKINLILNGGNTINYRIEEKDSFKVIGLKRNIEYKNANTDVEKQWKSFLIKSTFSKIKPKYGINIDKNMENNSFEYIIGDDYITEEKYPKKFEIIEIPKLTWAVFPCKGSASTSLRKINEKIFKEWLPNNTNYEISDGYNIEMYSDPKKYKKGLEDANYYCEIWIPVTKK